MGNKHSKPKTKAFLALESNNMIKSNASIKTHPNHIESSTKLLESEWTELYNIYETQIEHVLSYWALQINHEFNIKISADIMKIIRKYVPFPILLMSKMKLSAIHCYKAILIGPRKSGKTTIWNNIVDIKNTNSTIASAHNFGYKMVKNQNDIQCKLAVWDKNNISSYSYEDDRIYCRDADIVMFVYDISLNKTNDFRWIYDAIKCLNDCEYTMNTDFRSHSLIFLIGTRLDLVEKNIYSSSQRKEQYEYGLKIAKKIGAYYMELNANCREDIDLLIAELGYAIAIDNQYAAPIGIKQNKLFII